MGAAHRCSLSRTDCGACAARELCTRAKEGRRSVYFHLREEYEALNAARARMSDPEWKKRYMSRWDRRHALTRRACVWDATEPLYRVGEDKSSGGLHGRCDERGVDCELAEWIATGQNTRDALCCLGADTEFADSINTFAARAIEGHVERGEAFLLEMDGIPVSLCTHNARVRDNVQIGGVWTPPELRGRGYARRVVAGALRVADREGVKRAVLFTENPAARRSYEALGFRRVGDFGVIVLAT